MITQSQEKTITPIVKKQATALLFTHESADRFNPKNECSPYRELDLVSVKEVIQIAEDKGDIDIHRLNGNQSKDGLLVFTDNYEEVILVLAYPEEGTMRCAADELIKDNRKVSITSPAEIMTKAKKMNFSYTII